MTDIQIITCHKICDYYGIEKQLRQTVEELAELIQAICKLNRPLTTVGLAENLIEVKCRHEDVKSEIADVEIMLEQIKGFYLYQESVEKEIDYKLKRQLDRIAKERGAQ